MAARVHASAPVSTRADKHQLVPTNRSGDAVAPIRAHPPRSPYAGDFTRVSSHDPMHVLRTPGQPLDEATRSAMEARFGHDFSRVRVHTDAAAASSAGALQANAYAHGDRIVFGRDRYAPSTAAGRRLLAHELAHVVQQSRGSPGSAETHEREAVAAERDSAPTVRPRLRPTPAPLAPTLQCQPDRAALEARLKAVRARLAVLRAEEQAFGDEFARSRLRDVQRESDARATAKLKAEARSDAAANALWGGQQAAARIRRAGSVSQTGNTVTLDVKIQLAYLALPDAEARRRAASDIPRIEAAIRDVWQVKIASGEYAGVQFRLLPRVTYVAKGSPAPADAFLIQVRGPDTGPSSGDPVHGLISLAPAHLEGSRVIVVAHELAHLFGFVDAYLTMTYRDKRTQKMVEQWSVARADPARRPDLLGMIDPKKLKELEAKGAISKQDVARQTGAVRIWEEEASIVLAVFGVAPPPPQRPTPESEDFDPAEELERLRREKEGQLGEIQRRTRRIEGVQKSLGRVEEIIRLEAEERALVQRLAPTPAQP